VNLGAIFASGAAGPNELADWTWDQVALVSESIQLYHIDLATRIATGKSAIVEKPDRSWMHADPATATPEQRAAIASAELGELAAFLAGPGIPFDALAATGGADLGDVGLKITGV
jgi:hypothetical protein